MPSGHTPPHVTEENTALLSQRRASENGSPGLSFDPELWLDRGYTLGVQTGLDTPPAPAPAASLSQFVEIPKQSSTLALPDAATNQSGWPNEHQQSQTINWDWEGLRP